MSRSIDAKIKERALRKSELEELGQEISASARNVVVCFIDLSDSTDMKHDGNADEWLGYVYEFLRRLTDLVAASRGTVVKRIGDELMATFDSVSDAENFSNELIADQRVQRFKFKAAFDFGPAYHFQFIEGREDDPYGLVVDRSARIAKLAKAGALLVSGEYFSEVENKSAYLEVGSFPLKGLREKPSIYLRSLLLINAEEYLQPLLNTLNNNRTKFDSFRSIGREFKVDDIRTSISSASGTGRPFLARELLNLPKCPLSLSEFVKQRAQRDKPEMFDESLRGQIVEWTLSFESYDADDGYIRVMAFASDKSHNFCMLMMPRFYLDTLRNIQKGTLIRVRGILKYSSERPILDYVDIETIA